MPTTESDRGLYQPEADVRPLYRGLLVFALFLLLGFGLYFNSLHAPFIFDDKPNIVENPHIRVETLAPGALLEAGAQGNPRRFVANISFALNYFLHDYEVFGYHLINVTIHVLTGFFLFYLFSTTLRLPALRDRYGNRSWVPLLAATIWFVHPLHTQSVTYIVQRMNSLATLFFVLCLLLYARGRLAPRTKERALYFGGCALAGVLSLFSKENAATLPVFILLYEWIFFQQGQWRWFRAKALPIIGLAGLAGGIAWLYLGKAPLTRILSGYGEYDFNLIERVLTEFRVVWHYLSLLAFPDPDRLKLIYEFPFSRSLLDPPSTLLALAAIIILLGLATFTTRKAPLVCFAILWYFGNLAIESTVIPLDLVFEHRTYLPSMFVILLAVAAAFRFLPKDWLKFGLVGATVLVFSFWTVQRNEAWNDRLTFWTDNAEKTPDSALVHSNLGMALNQTGSLKTAVHHLNRALELDPDHDEAHNNLGLALANLGRHERAAYHFAEALRLNPGHANAHNNYGLLLVQQGKMQEAVKHFSKAYRLRPDHPEIRHNLRQAYRLLQKGSSDGIRTQIR